ncbi:dynein regulatory complex protein 9-like [Ostrinia nubilalis]|uniref:dynein regulatory complex protein 9-like n=1 Tax=Ostrinia nubilalis TaxID=29057 RepID=UPI0030824066
MSTTPASEEGENDVSSNKPCLLYLQSSLFASVLEDTITELRVLAETNNELRILKAWSDMGVLRSIKYGIDLPPVTDELEGIDPRNLGCNEYKLNKLDADRKLAINVVIGTYKDLSMHRTYSALHNHVKSIIQLDTYREELEEDEAKNRILRHDLMKQMRQQRNHIKSVLYDTDATIDDLKTLVEDALLYSECRSRYVDNWQRARTEQHVQTIKDTEKGPSESIEYYKQRTDHEQRVHSEVEVLINIAINETLEKVDQWMNKYDKDMEGIDLKIQIRKNEYQNMYDKRVGLEETIEKHDVLMKEWIHFKEEREKARLYREKMTKSAIIVQAWWRGLLVRRQLGPYKVSKKKGGGKKK